LKLTSAKDKRGIDELFDAVAEECNKIMLEAALK